HDVVVHVAHYFHLILFPAEDALFDQHLVNWRLIETAADKRVKLIAVIGDGRAAAAERETGPHDGGQADHFHHPSRVFEGLNRLAAATFQADLLHRGLEQRPVLGLVDHLRLSADHLDAIFFEDAVPG